MSCLFGNPKISEDIRISFNVSRYPLVSRILTGDPEPRSGYVKITVNATWSKKVTVNTDILTTLASNSVKVSRRLLNVCVHSEFLEDFFSWEPAL